MGSPTIRFSLTVAVDEVILTAFCIATETGECPNPKQHVMLNDRLTGAFAESVLSDAGKGPG